MNTILHFIKEKKVFFILGLILVILFTVRTVLFQKQNTQIFYTVKQENLVDTVTVSGTYKTASQVEVTSPSNGTIRELYVQNGDEVKKGDKLFYIESTATTDQQNAANVSYQNALSALTTAQNTQKSLDATMWAKQQAYINAQNTQNYKNNHTQNPATKNDYTDLEKFAIDNAVVQTQKDFEAAEQTYKTTNVGVAAAQAQVQQTKRLYAETQSVEVTAPAAGKIINLQAQIGDQVSAPSNASGGSGPTVAPLSTTSTQPVLVIGNLNNPYIQADISEDYASRINVGQKASLVFDSLKEKTFTGSVSSIATVGTTNQGIVTYPARITAEDLSSEIRPNMTALITIETLRKDNVLDVPNSAIINKNGRLFVQRADNKQLLPVTSDLKGFAKTEVTDGISAGTVIIANPD
ncbi:MAG: efflux RND transporter periplasmic adaptor subunit [Candidatus Levyibacteriota bacterium]